MSLEKTKVVEWMKAAIVLAAAKSKEMELRKAICDEVLGSQIKGVKHLIVEGLDVAATGKLNTKVDTEVLDAIWVDLTPAERACVKYKPELVAADYKKVTDSSKLHQAVITTPGTPTLKVKPVK